MDKIKYICSTFPQDVACHILSELTSDRVIQKGVTFFETVYTRAVLLPYPKNFGMNIDIATTSLYFDFRYPFDFEMTLFVQNWDVLLNF